MHDTHNNSVAEMNLRYVTIGKFAAESRYTEDAIRTKIKNGVWLHGSVWIKAPDGRN
ncbi:hypothetical protein QFZ41_003667 [Luteibacter sp. W1I16]|uniref:hypothetical protein n=1 Tax=Luteibacter sp. W1I16 TaxID=3373922 RepID=UPI003D1EF27C